MTCSTASSTRCPAAGARAEDADDSAIFSVAIVGRPNVGKSTLFNRLVGDDRSVVHDAPGTTRDSIDTIVDTDDGPLRFVDTAGMRRRSRIDEPTEYFSLVRALQSVDRADAALLVIDATEGVHAPGPAPRRAHRRRRHRDRRSCSTSGTCSTPKAAPRRSAAVADRLAFLSYAPVLTVSALTGRMTHAHPARPPRGGSGVPHPRARPRR